MPLSPALSQRNLFDHAQTAAGLWNIFLCNWLQTVWLKYAQMMSNHQPTHKLSWSCWVFQTKQLWGGKLRMAQTEHQICVFFNKIQFPAILQHPLHGTENFRQWSMDLAEIFLIWPHDLWTTPDIAHSIQNHGFVWKSYAPKNINGLSLFFKLHVIDWVFWSHLPRTSRLMSCRNSGLKQLLHLRLLVRPMVP